jgi:hypothetical protein
MSARAVLVLGFHRSGTSMTTRVLDRLGIPLGPPEGLLAASESDNPRGYFEPRWLVETNDTLLAALGGRYHAPPALPDGWWERPGLEPVREYARAQLDASFAGAPVWAIKDPRLCLTLPFWQALLAERGDEAAYVVCVRSPLETAASLTRRGIYAGMDVRAWGDVWLEYTRRALDGTIGADRLLLTYEEQLGNPRASVLALARLAGVAVPAAAELTSIEASVEGGLRHHASSPADVMADERLSPAVREAYASLCSRAASAVA